MPPSDLHLLAIKVLAETPLEPRGSRRLRAIRNLRIDTDKKYEMRQYIDAVMWAQEREVVPPRVDEHDARAAGWVPLSDQIPPEAVYLDAARAAWPEAHPATHEEIARHPANRRAVAAIWHAWQDAPPGSGSRTWQLPEEPGPEVTHVQLRFGAIFCRDGDRWRNVDAPPGSSLWRWDELLYHSPLTDVSAEVSSTEEERDAG